MEQVLARRGREGSRWINERPSSEDVAEWFTTVPLHEAMEHERFVGGITLIPGKDKGEEIVGYRDDGAPVLAERLNMTFTPYMKVETRVAYFWNYMEKHPEWVGLLEPIVRDGGDPLGLPDGYFRFPATKPDGKVVSFIGHAMQVRVLKRETCQWIEHYGRRVLEGEPIFGGAGTKIVSTATKWDADPNSVMKAETGAVGRALGMAGILVLPGSGVATAEDMQDAAEAASRGTGAVDAHAAVEAAAAGEAPLDGDRAMEDPDVALRGRAAELIRRLEEQHPDELKHFQEWARGRRFRSLNELTSPALKGVVKKLEKILDDASDGRPPAAPELADVELAGETA